jgi:hypothetical protein
MLLTWIADWQIATPQRPAPTVVQTNTQSVLRTYRIGDSTNNYAWVIKFNQSLDPDGRDLAWLLRTGWEIYSYDDSLS